ncbi:MAG: TIGR04282 family arsenosugar biosynthesis glycosyltransferase [Pikeienuella sp.]
MTRRRLIIFLKEPRLGRVKTRLAADIGSVAATNWYRHQSTRLINRLERDPRWQVELAVSPDRATSSRCWPLHLLRYGQGGGGLGERMARALKVGQGPTILIGADIPNVTPGHIADAFHRLAGADAVFGPANDGGFWLVGLSHPAHAPRHLFANARWSTPHAMADAAATMKGGRIAYAQQMTDVDNGADLRATLRR